MARVYLENITKVFNETVEAVKDFTLEVPDHALASLLGPSGCGKTTTMRIIAGLETPTAGRVFLGDQDVTELPARERDVAMVFQFPVAYPTMNVYDNIAFALRAKARGKRIPESEVDERVKKVAEILGLSSVLRENPTKLDAGTRQKVSLARAVVRRPRVYLLDEPLTNLDPGPRLELRSELKKLQAELGQTMIYVTHDQAEAMTLSDKIGVMNKGLLIQYDTPENIYSKPADTFVAWFIGNPGMNRIDCDLVEKEGRAWLRFGDVQLDISDFAAALKKTASGNELTLGIRPEHVEVSKTRVGSEWFQSKCTLVEPAGGRQILHLEIGDRSVRAKTAGESGIREGHAAWARFPRNSLRIFDRKSTRLLL
jgi:multiple sugar transport system ATP-binding protein